MKDIEGFSVNNALDVSNVCQNKIKKKSGGFHSFGLSASIIKGIKKKGYKVPTPIQRKTIPLILQGRDVVAMARTGSGKTACFLLPMFEKLQHRFPKTRFGARALILTPTRELALQTIKFIKELGKFTKLHSLGILGGESLDYQFGALHKNPDVIVATPGRFLHLCVEMDLKLNSVEYVVFDEADRLFEMGFGEQLQEILDRLGDARQTVLFSATLPKLLVNFAKAGLSNPVLLRLDVDSKLPDTLDLVFLSVKQDEKVAALLCILQALPTNSQSLIFVATKHHVEYLHNILNNTNISNTYIYSNLDPSARKINAAKFQNKKSSVLIVTDVAARGIDIPQLDFVINYHFPAKPKLFVHRVGRCARAGRTGTTFSLVASEELPYAIDLHLFLGRKLNTIPMFGLTDKKNIYCAIGRIPPFLIETNQSELIAWHQSSEEMRSLEQVCNNGYKKYLQTRPGASIESVKRTKELDFKNIGIHPFFQSNENQDIDTLKVLEQMTTYKPKGTIFELNLSSKTKCYSVMKKTKKAHEKHVLEHKKALEEREKIINENNEFDTSEIGLLSDKADNFKPFVKTKRRKTLNEDYYVPYFAPDQHTEKGFEINSFTNQANKATFDLTEDCDEGLLMQKQLRKWDKKKKKLIGIPDQKVGKIKTESGNWISASYKSNRYSQWKEKSKVTEIESDEEDGEKIKKLTEKDFPNTRWGRHNRKVAEKLKLKANLIKPEKILKRRIIKEKRRQRSIPRSKRNSYKNKENQNKKKKS